MWRRGRVARGKYMVIRFRPRQGATSRFGFVVSSAIAKRAVVRNTIKRRLRAASVAVGGDTIDAVIYATKSATTASYQQLLTELRDIVAFTNAKHPSPHH